VHLLCNDMLRATERDGNTSGQQQKIWGAFLGLGEVGVNLKKAKVKRLLSLLPDDLGLEDRCTRPTTLTRVATIELGELINYYKKGANDFRTWAGGTAFFCSLY
jgi:hypothetical protein